jgi:hypothetical protein
VSERHKHVFAMRPAEDGEWTLFEPWWHRLLSATITAEQARKFLLWGGRGDVLLVREDIPGAGGQVRGWMNCAALTSYLLGRRYWVWTPHALFRRLVQEPHVCRVDVSALLGRDLSDIATPGSRVVRPCSACWPDAPSQPGAPKPFCMECGRDLVPARDWAPAGVAVREPEDLRQPGRGARKRGHAARATATPRPEDRRKGEAP